MKSTLDSKTILSILIGTILEWYDFSLFASMAPIIGHLFFPSKIPALSLLATFGVFASGFLMRPLGAVIFGHIGDRYGRRNALALTIFLMAVPTTLIGLLPTFSTLGITASIILIGLRLLQGLAASGEYPGAVCFLTEMAPVDKRGFWGSFSMFGVVGGLLLGSIINSILTSVLTMDQMNSWGWRIPFLLGLPLGVVGWFFRYRVKESFVFKSSQKTKTLDGLPLKQLLMFNFGNLVKLTVIFSLSTISFYLSFVYVNSYLISTHQLTFHQGLIANMISSIVLILLIPLFGFISDKFNRKIVMLSGAACLFLFFYPIFTVFLSGNFHYLILGQVLLAFFIAMLSGPMAAMSAEAFATVTRYSGVAIALNIGASFFGATCPLVATFLVQHFGNETIPSVYPMLFAVMGVVVISAFKPNQANDLSADNHSVLVPS